MALNITFDGFTYMEDGGLSSLNVAYQAFFHKVNAGSSSDQWNQRRVVENTGYWNINLGDGDWLTQDGNAASGDVITVFFWAPATADRLDDCTQLEEWGSFSIILDGSSTFSTNTQVRSNICPSLFWGVQPSGDVNETINVTNGSTDTHGWDYFGTTMRHQNRISDTSVTAMNVNRIVWTSYDWGDGNQDNNLPGISNGSHQYTAAGSYDIEIVIEDACGCTVTGTENIAIANNAPIPNIAMSPSIPDPNEPVSFTYTGTDVNNAITNIHWTIEDNGAYGSTATIKDINARDDVIPHTSGEGTDWFGQAATAGAFTNPGNHLVSIIVEWDDGFTTQIINYSETFSQGMFTGPTVDFTQDPPEATLSGVINFTNTSTDTDRVGTGEHGYEYSWKWTEGALVEQETNKPFSYVLQKTATTDSAQVELCAEWSDGWETHDECVEKDVVFATDVTVTPVDCYYELNIIGTSEDGSVTGYGWTVFSGTGETGPWTEMWTSPADLAQADLE